MNHHNLAINAKKTFLTGRDHKGKASHARLKWVDKTKGQETISFISSVQTTETYRYLGIHMNMELDWTSQIQKMNTAVNMLTAKLRHRNITTNQGLLALKQVILPRLESGFRHTPIPTHQLETWDAAIAKAFLISADLTHNNIHGSAVATALNVKARA
jgi:hypothetical protein